jgi:hypothetical protein
MHAFASMNLVLLWILCVEIAGGIDEDGE